MKYIDIIAIENNFYFNLKLIMMIDQSDKPIKKRIVNINEFSNK